jgi:hypothetical protein
MAIGDVGLYGRRVGVALIISGVLMLLGVGAYAGKGLIFNGFQEKPVPEAIAKQLKFSPLVLEKPVTKEGPAMSDFKYDAKEQVYSYIVRPTDSQTVTVSQQASPPSFSEVPEQYMKLLDGLNRYSTVETVNGTVYLTRPKQGQQVAVMNERGVLMFARLNNGSLTNEDWKKLLERLNIYKITD